MFQNVAPASRCHKMDGVKAAVHYSYGGSAEINPLDVLLKDIVEAQASPSTRNTRPGCFETGAGKSHTGIILEEKGNSIKLIENPLAKTEPIVLKLDDITRRWWCRSCQSLSPTN